MEFIPSKCKILYISTKHDPPKSKYTFFVTELDQVESISYVGVTVNSKLKWFQHIASISTDATKNLGLTRRNLWNCPKNVKESSYFSIVGPKLEYVSASWDPHSRKTCVHYKEFKERQHVFVSRISTYRLGLQICLEN